MGWKPCKCVPPTECRLLGAGKCAQDASIYSFTMAGLGNYTCGSCADWNGTFDLKYMLASRWDTPASVSNACGHVGGDPLYRLTYDPGTSYYVLTALGLGYQWRRSIASWTCAGSNVLSLKYPLPVPPPCSGVPATITLTPCVFLCGLATGVMPATCSVTVADLVDELCNGCNEFNGTYVLAAHHTCYWVTSGTWTCAASLVTPTWLIHVWLDTAPVTGCVRLWAWLGLGSVILPAARSDAWYYCYNSGSASPLALTGTFTLGHQAESGHVDSDGNQCQHLPAPTLQVTF